MTIDNSSQPERALEDETPIKSTDTNPTTDQRSLAEKFWNWLLHLGLGESAVRIGTSISTVLVVLVVVLVMSKFYINKQKVSITGTEKPSSTQVAPFLPIVDNVQPALLSSFGIDRLAQLHTSRPAKPRGDVIEYEIVKGDTLFGIAEKFGLKPETLLWSNRHILGDNVDNIFPGVKILIPPFDGAIYQWHTGDGLNGVSGFYKVAPDVIIDWPGNNLDRATLGDLSLPNIKEGTLLFVPNGVGDFTDWLPKFTRANPAEAQIMGPGFCGSVDDGPIGTGAPFLWPSIEKYLSGYDYSPSTNHRAIDIAGKVGNAVYAVDDGVVVYSGWNNNGYGNLIVIDHGNGWQSVYAHLDTLAKECGDFVWRGDVIGTLGNTGNSSGPHLHFELRNEEYGAVNPWDFLQQ